MKQELIIGPEYLKREFVSESSLVRLSIITEFP